ncbi:MAG TPA: hypothetical protein VJW55_04415, partial [Candidatus Angelobacter sp.]|nr:hypothetical protein [Candidatus Angelobacter sp.]
NCKFESVQQLTAVPVTGECELASAPRAPLTGNEPHYISGMLDMGNEIVEIVALEKLISTEARA